MTSSPFLFPTNPFLAKRQAFPKRHAARPDRRFYGVRFMPISVTGVLQDLFLANPGVAGRQGTFSALAAGREGIRLGTLQLRIAFEVSDPKRLARFEVITGQEIRQGEPVGAVGASGRVTAPHLHYEVRVRKTPVNPYPLPVGETCGATGERGLSVLTPGHGSAWLEIRARQRESEAIRGLTSHTP